MKTTNEDHKLLRSITRDTITNDLELIDFGLQLELPPSIVKQKLQDYPRSIETASYMVASEWWDSSGNSRDEKYESLRGAVHSMGKKCTAKWLESVEPENNLRLTYSNHISGRIPNGRRQNPMTNLDCNDIENGDGAIGGRVDIAGLDGDTRNLAICGGAGTTGPDSHVHNRSSVAMSSPEIVEITDEQEGNHESCEIEYAHPRQKRSIQSEVADPFYDSGAAEMTGRTIDTTQFNSQVNGQPTIATSSDETEMKAYTQLDRSDNDERPNSSGLRGEENFNSCISSSAPNPEILDQVENKTQNIAPARSSNLSGQIDADDIGEEPVDDSGRGLNNSQQMTAMRSDGWLDDFEDENRSTIFEDRMISSVENSEKESFKKRRLRPRHEDNFACLRSDDEEGLDVETSPLSRLLDSNHNSKINLDDPEVVYHLLPEVNIINAPRPQVNFESAKVNDQTGELNDQAGVANDQTGMVNDQAGLEVGQTRIENGQTDVMNGQTAAVNGKMTENKYSTSKRSKGFLYRLLRLFRRKRVPVMKKSDAELAVSFSVDKTIDD